MAKEKIQLGDTVKDTITGITGIAVARINWIAGCDRIIVQPKAIKKGSELPDSFTLDEPLLKIIKRATRKKKKDNNGGPIHRGAMRYGN